MADRIEKLLERISQPPPFPVAVRILKVTQDEKAGANTLANVINKDQSFTARILKIANSASFGQSRKVTTVSRAVAVLGFETIKALALTLYTFGHLPPEKSEVIDMVQMWEHNLGCAVGARLIATHLKYPTPEEAFVAGLLHDMGKTLFLQYSRKEFIEAVRMAETTGMSLTQAETKILGTDHATVGEVWSRKWNFPPVIQQTIRYHHTALSVPATVDSSVHQIIALVHVADLFCEACHIGKGGDSGFEPVEKGVWTLLKLVEAECAEILGPVVGEVEETKKIFGIATGETQPAQAQHSTPEASLSSPSFEPLKSSPSVPGDSLVSAPRTEEVPQAKKTKGKVIRLPVKNRRFEKPAEETVDRVFTILVVEDQFSLREVLSLFLRRNGYQIRTAGNGKTALNILAAEKINLVLLDLVLPQMDGFEVLEHLRQGMVDNIPYVIVVSSIISQLERKKVLDLGADEYLPKPFHLAPLLERIQMLENRTV